MISKMKNRGTLAALLGLGSALALASSASASTIRVTFTNLSPNLGTHFTSPWVGFHNGTFDTYNFGESVNGFPGSESLIEDGPPNTGVANRFSSSGAGTAQGTINAPAGVHPLFFQPGESGFLDFDEAAVRSSGRYFSYMSMVIPSNDFFFANDDPLEHPIFDAQGNFIGGDFIILGNEIYDGGSEVNTESTTDTAFFGQAVRNTGTSENGVVHAPTSSTGFITGGPILSDPRYANANFLASGYQVARIQIQLVPEPGTTVGLFAFGGLLFMGRGMSRRLKANRR